MPERQDDSKEWPLLSPEQTRASFELIGTGELSLPVFEDLDYDGPVPVIPRNPPEPGWGQGFDFTAPPTVGNFRYELEVDGILSGWGSRSVREDENGRLIWEERGPECIRSMIQAIDSTNCSCAVGKECPVAVRWEPYRWDRWRMDCEYVMNLWGVEWDPTLTF